MHLLLSPHEMIHVACMVASEWLQGLACMQHMQEESPKLSINVPERRNLYKWQSKALYLRQITNPEIPELKTNRSFSLKLSLSVCMEMSSQIYAVPDFCCIVSRRSVESVEGIVWLQQSLGVTETFT